ncbi:MAG: hypothetical protein ACKO1F_07580 [Flammeovirgaceae bacterium]
MKKLVICLLFWLSSGFLKGQDITATLSSLYDTTKRATVYAKTTKAAVGTIDAT